MHYTVYKVTNTINQKYYIGVHQTTDPNDSYLGSGNLIKLAVTKYGSENFVKEILADFDTPEPMFKMEKDLLTEELLNNKNCYNIREGGIGGFVYDENGANLSSVKFAMMMKDPEYKAWVIKRRRELWTSENSKRRRAINLANPHIKAGFFRGQKHTEETKNKIGKTNREKVKGENNGSFGSCWITYNNENKRINKTELQHYTEKGWILGRSISDQQRLKCKQDTSNRIWIKNETSKISRFVSKTVAVALISEGWIRGRL